MPSNYIIKAGNCYRYRRRVPKMVAHLDTRKEIKISLKTSDEKTARIRADIYNNQMEVFWRSLIDSNSKDNFDTKYLLAVQLAKSQGFAYKTPEQIAASSLSEITKRIEAVDRKIPSASKNAKIDAFLGNATKPQILLKDCWGIFESLVYDRLVEKSPDQIRKWKNVRKAAMRNFIQVSSIRYLEEVDREVILKFWEWLNEKIKLGYSANTANKQLSNLKDVIKTISSKNQISLDVGSLFAETSFKETVISRPPFEADYVRDILLKAVGELKDRDKYGFWAIADTGMRQSELFGLQPEDIFLESEIPYVWIRPRKGYRLKTPDSKRKIPLVGSALISFQKFPNGFSRLGNAESFSAAINDFLTRKNLRPTPEHSAYSLRHTFKDRLRDYGETGAPEEVIDELMGHKKPGVYYGRGHKLETKYEVLKKIAF